MPDIDHLIVGYGFRGRGWHRHLRKTSGHRAAGAVDPRPEARGMAEADGLPAWASLEDALGDSPARAAIVSSPHRLHVPQAAACLDAGKAVLVEKPMAGTLDEARPLIEAARRSGQPAIVTQTKRFIRREHVIGKLLRSGALGTVGGVTMNLIYPARPDIHPLDVDDALESELVHQLDTLRLRFGMPSRVVPGSPAPDGRFAHGFLLSLEWDDGLTATCTYRRSGRVEHYHEMLEGDEAHTFVVRERVYVVRGRGVGPGRSPRRIWLPRRTHPERALLGRLTEWLEGRPATDVGVEDNLRTVAVLEAAKRAFATAAPVRLQDVAPEVPSSP